eukprot:2314029-Pyramimonas_sp.AAC.1
MRPPLLPGTWTNVPPGPPGPSVGQRTVQIGPSIEQTRCFVPASFMWPMPLGSMGSDPPRAAGSQVTFPSSSSQ